MNRIVYWYNRYHAGTRHYVIIRSVGHTIRLEKLYAVTIEQDGDEILVTVYDKDESLIEQHRFVKQNLLSYSYGAHHD